MAGAKVLYFSGEIPQGDPLGDQQDLFRKLRLLSKEKNHPILASFLDIVTTASKDECSRLSRDLRKVVPTFENVLDLTEHVLELRKTPLGGAIERVLSLVFQLGSFIAYHEIHPLEYDFQASNTFLIGRGAGLLSAAAIGMSPRISMLLDVAEYVVQIAFRFGIVVDEVCRSLEVSPDEINAEGAWVYCAHGADEAAAQKAVDAFNIENHYSETSMASVFNVDGTSVSIGGPPSTLKSLFSQSEFFKSTKNVPMRKIQGFWHTSRAYGTEHIQQMMPEVQGEHHMHLPLFSPVTGEAFALVDAGSLLRDLMEEIMTRRIHWNLTIDVVTERLRQLSPASIKLVSIQPSHYVESLLKHWQDQVPRAVASAQDMMSAVMHAPLGTSRARDAKSSKIAVLGMACRFPGGADSTEKFWELLAQGKDAHTTIPAERFNVDTHVDPTGQKLNTSKTPYGCFVENPGAFDATFFGMSPREAEQTDPMHRLALVTAYEAMEHAGFVNGRGIHNRRVGTFYGQASDDYREVNSGQEVGTYFIPGGCRAFAPGRINYAFNFWGPSFSVDTACSSSLAAIQAACTSLWSGDVDMALAGGLNILTNSDVYAGLSSGHFLSPTGNCKTWDVGADGYCRSDGVGSVVLKRLEDAEADNDNILAVVLSAATDHSAEAVSITHPHDQAQAHLFTQVARRAGVDPLAVGYVEMHGTGTQAGDKNEMTSVTSVFAPENRRANVKDFPLHIGTVKSNFGHGEAAAGIMAFIKTMLVFQKGAIPPHIGIKTDLNPALPDLTNRNVVIPKKLTSWESGSRQRLAMVNNFGAAGGNTSIILEEANPRPRTGEDTRQLHPITVSAKTAFSLSENLKRLVEYMQSESKVSISDLSYTLSARRSHYNYRVAINAGSRAEAIDSLKPHIETSLAQKPHSGKQPPIAFAFTGQGTFYIGIAKQLYRDSPVFRKQLIQLDGLARRQRFESFLPVIEGTCERGDVYTVSMHLSIVCVEIALARLWESYGIKPGVVIGHSLGEYAALAVAGVISESAAVFLVGTRAQLLDSICTSGTHGMLSVTTSAANIQELAEGLEIEIACINSPNETVVGGPDQDLDRLATALTRAGHRTFRLPVAHAYHTAQMDSVLDSFMEQAKAVVCKRPRIPVVSPRHAKVLSTTDEIDVSYLAGATRERVDFAGALNDAWETGIVSDSTIWMEMGHHPTLCGFIKRTLPATRLACVSLHRDQDSWTTLTKALCNLYNAGVNLDWNAYHLPFEKGLRLIEAPTYAWNNKNYWIQYRGDWNLTKGQIEAMPKSVVKGFSTSSIHRILSEQYNGSEAVIKTETSVTDPSLREIVDGHAMNGFGVASSFLHADMALTLAKRISDKALPSSTSRGINVKNFEYHEPVVRRQNTDDPQPINITATADLDKMEVEVKWFNPAKDLWYCHATASYEDSSTWLSDWSRSSRLITSRIEALNDMAVEGSANKLTTDLAYTLFGKLVDYSSMYRTMQSVILNDDEAVAEVVYPGDTAGTWTVPPHFIDGCISLSGFILNGGTHFENTKNFYITPSWKSMRFAKPLMPGGRYQAYCRMAPRGGNSFVGDVYILEGSEIVGLVEAIMFLQWPRVMLGRFFSPPGGASENASLAPAPSKPAKPSLSPPHPSTAKPGRTPQTQPSSSAISPELVQGISTPESSNTSASSLDDGIEDAGAKNVTDQALVMIAEELAVDIGQLTDEVELSDLGLDSLMSLVLSQKLREGLSIEMRDAFFLEVDTVGELKKLLQ